MFNLRSVVKWNSAGGIVLGILVYPLQYGNRL